MSIETPNIKWFEGLSPIVRCANCTHWERNKGHIEDPFPDYGECKARGDGSSDDFYCKFFELNQNANVG